MDMQKTCIKGDKKMKTKTESSKRLKIKNAAKNSPLEEGAKIWARENGIETTFIKVITGKLIIGMKNPPDGKEKQEQKASLVYRLRELGVAAVNGNQFFPIRFQKTK
jgi:hypothetical protein